MLADGRFGALPTTSTYHFVDVAVFALSGMVIGILLAVGAWQLRAARGWQMIVALVGGSLLGAAHRLGGGVVARPRHRPGDRSAPPPRIRS